MVKSQILWLSLNTCSIRQTKTNLHSIHNGALHKKGALDRIWRLYIILRRCIGLDKSAKDVCSNIYFQFKKKHIFQGFMISKNLTNCEKKLRLSITVVYLFQREGFNKIYGMSFIWFDLIAIVLVIVIGLITSRIVGKVSR